MAKRPQDAAHPPVRTRAPLTAAQRAELDRRLETLDQDRLQGITWAALKAELVALSLVPKRNQTNTQSD
jgi:putative addiction module component (TIGR02574 family)